MNITFISNNNISEGFGDRSSSFNHCDKVIGPDGTIYDTKQIIALVNNACEELSNMTGGLINEYLVALPIVYTFQVPTMATDSRFIYMNPGFVLELVDMCGETTMGIAFVILHEVYHNLYLHKQREAANPVKFSDHVKANAAQDYEINWIIEHSFPDQRVTGQYDPDDPDDSPYEVDGITKKQLFAGVTNMCNGLIDDKFGGKPWEEIYDLISTPPKEKDDENDSNIIPLTPDYKNGYRDGWETAIRELRAEGLVESVKINDDFLYKVVKLYESTNSSDYDTGYNAGYEAAMITILAILFPSSGGASSDADNSDGPIPEKIDGLTPMKPINPPAQASSASSNKNPNTPVVMPNSQGGQSSASKNSQDNKQGTQDAAQNKQPGQTNGENNNQDDLNQTNTGDQNTSNNSNDTNKSVGNDVNPSSSNIKSPDASAQRSGQNSGITSQKQLDDIRKKGESTIKVGITDGSYTGKMSATANDKHIISTEEGDVIREKAGVKEIDNEKSVGKVKNPFSSSNLKGIAAAIKRLSKIGNQGGKGIGAVQVVLDKIESVFTPKIDWKEEMRTRFDACSMKLIDAGWNKKQLAYDAYSRFDDYEGDSIENIILMIDTSGSIFSKDYLMQVVSEFNELAKEVNPEHVDIVLFCGEIYYHHEFETSSKIPDLRSELEQNASTGGTIYSGCFEYIDEYYIKKGRDFACCVIFTDGDVTTALLPPKNELRWDPGTIYNDDSKLLWFVLLDEDDKVELPYGGIIQMSQADFVKTLSVSESVQNINKLYIPRRSIMNNKINEAFKKISSQKAELEKDRLSTMPNSNVEADANTNARKRIKELKERHSNIQAYYASDLDKVKEDIIHWLKYNTELHIDIDEWHSDILAIKDDLFINLNPNKGRARSLTIKGKALENIPNYILFGDIPENLEIGFNRKLEHFPAAFAYATVGSDFMCTNMPNLKSLDEGPSCVKGSYILTGCDNLESLDGAPVSHKNFGGYFLSDSTKFTDDDFYNTVDNGGIMKKDNFDVKESITSTRKKIKRLVESRIALGKYYNSLNEAFSSNILTRLASIPENKDALRRMKNDIHIFWSKIPDDIITPVYNSVTKVIQARRVVNKDTSMFGLTICCDKDDHIHIIGTGNNQGEWKGDTWKYISDDVVPTINDRLTLVRAANSSTLEEYAVKRAQTTLNELGINWEKGDVQKLSSVYTLDDLKFPHLYLVPEMCAHSYVIKGADDHKSAASKDPEFARNFSYKSQVARRNELNTKRRDAIAGSYFRGDLAYGPAAEKYFDYLVDDKLVAKVKDAYYTNHGVRVALEKMQDSVKNIYNRIGNELDEIKDSKLISGRAYALIYFRLIRSSYLAFNRCIDYEKEQASSLENKARLYNNSLSGNDEGWEINHDTLKKLKHQNLSKSDALDDIKTESYRNLIGWYKQYMLTLKTFAQILSKIAEAKRGNPDALEDYANVIDEKIPHDKVYDDKFGVIYI